MRNTPNDALSLSDTQLQEFAKELSNTERLVFTTMKAHRETWDSDKYLYWQIFHIYGIDIPWEKFRELPKFETVRRIRQKIQEGTLKKNMPPLFLPTTEVERARRGKEETYRKMFGKTLDEKPV